MARHIDTSYRQFALALCTFWQRVEKEHTYMRAGM